MKTNSTEKKPELIVGIGASAGGLDAISDFFRHIPARTGIAFVIIQHLSPDFKSMMKELLAKHTKMPISTVSRKTRIRPDHIYLNPRNKNLVCSGDSLELREKPSKQKLNLPIDLFFHSLGEIHKEKSVSIILSGTGTDGSRGINSIKETGGTIMVQDPSTAQFDGMPNAAIRTQFAEITGSPEGMEK
jgi:two-component system CheB/CheR fusion protein